MALVYFIRHGQASFGMEHYDKLSEVGFAQSLVLGRFLARCNTNFSGFYSGSKQRQLDTARCVMKEISGENGLNHLNILHEFDEYDAAGLLKRYFEREDVTGSPPMERIRQSLKDPKNFFIIFQKAVWSWFSGDLFGAGLESRLQFRERVLAGLARITADLGDHAPCAVFTSGGVIAVAMGHALGISDEETYDLAWRIRNASVSVFSEHRGHLKLLSFNSVAHFEVSDNHDLITYR
jgi:broad specificity phosphatase PhoE